MGIGKDKLTYDATDANSLAASDTIGSFLLDSTGTALTSTLLSGKQALDVNVANAIAVDVDADSGDSVKIGDGSSHYLAINNDGSINITDNGGSLTVDGTVAATQSGSWTVGITGTVAVTQSTSPWVVSATALDIRHLSHSTDSVASWLSDGSGNAIGSTSGALNVNISSGSVTTSDAALANTPVKSTATSVTNSAAVILASQLSARKYLTMQNLGSAAVFVGDSSVTASTGLRLSNGAMLEGLRLGPAISLKAITSAGTGDLRIFEAA